ncbi:glycosyltransferase family 2 protein [Thermoproteota archaeon]
MRENSVTVKNAWIIISAYNEERVISSVIDDLSEHGYPNTIVVDDGSRDATADICRKKGVTVLQHLINRGQGASLRTGMRYAVMHHDPDILVAFDGDGQHQASEIHALIKPILADRADLTIGSRFLGKKAENMPFIKRIILYAARLFTLIVTGTGITDSQSGFRAFSRAGMGVLENLEDRYANCSAAIEEAKRRNLRVKEVPVTIRYTDYSMKKGQPLSNGLKIMMRLILYKFRR